MKIKHDTSQNTEGQESRPLLTRRQVAAFFNVCTETIKRWDHAGILPVYRINSRVARYAQDDCDELKAQARGLVITSTQKAT
jgi:predicted site-specific integrase-resolvase